MHSKVRRWQVFVGVISLSSERPDTVFPSSVSLFPSKAIPHRDPCPIHVNFTHTHPSLSSLHLCNIQVHTCILHTHMHPTHTHASSTHTHTHTCVLPTHTHCHWFWPHREEDFLVMLPVAGMIVDLVPEAEVVRVMLLTTPAEPICGRITAEPGGGCVSHLVFRFFSSASREQ